MSDSSTQLSTHYARPNKKGPPRRTALSPGTTRLHHNTLGVLKRVFSAGAPQRVFARKHLRRLGHPIARLGLLGFEPLDLSVFRFDDLPLLLKSLCGFCQEIGEIARVLGVDFGFRYSHDYVDAKRRMLCDTWRY